MRLPLEKVSALVPVAQWKRAVSNGNILSAIQPREQVTGPPPVETGKPPNAAVYIITVTVCVSIMAVVIFYCSLKRLRNKGKEPKYIPTQFLKGRWMAWRSNKPSAYRTAEHLEPISESSTANNRSRTTLTTQTTTVTTGDAHPAEAVTTTAGIDRNTSVRSVMTLPAYMAAPGESERVLGREGERAGIDVVIEYPETVDEVEEQRREEEMEALYQVRLARRTEAAEREELRRLRREARERGDSVALEDLRQRTRAASGARANRTLEELREDHARLRDRQRAVSSVSYADLGIAHHDGTRIRANSEESERPLLGDAASMASSHYHRRDRSASSVLSIDSDLPSPGLTRSRANSRAESTLRRTSNSGAMSSPELVDAETDLADGGFPTHSPPEYEDIALEDGQTPADEPPEYISPVEIRAPELRSPVSPQSPQGSQQIGGMGLGISTASAERRRSSSTRGVGGTPQLPSLRLSTLPSIVVNTPTPINSSVPDERDLGSQRSL